MSSGIIHIESLELLPLFECNIRTRPGVYHKSQVTGFTASDTELHRCRPLFTLTTLRSQSIACVPSSLLCSGYTEQCGGTLPPCAVAMSDPAEPSISSEVAPATTACEAPNDIAGELIAELRPADAITGDAQLVLNELSANADGADEQLSAIEQSSISLHDQSSPRSLSTVDQPDASLNSRPSTAVSSVLRPATTFHLPVDPRFPSDPSPQLLAIIQAADEADRLTAHSHSPLLSERSVARGRGERPESAAALGGADTLQGLPSQSADYAASVVQARMRWRESTRAERAARVERRKDELLAEFEAEVKAALNSPSATKLPSQTAHFPRSKAANTKQPSTAVAVL